MNYGTIKKRDIANGPGIRVSLFVSGCRHHCKGCFQPETWSFSYGHEFTQETAEEILEALEPYYVHGLTILGGEPFEPENQMALVPFLRQFRRKYPWKSLWCYTGYTLETDLFAKDGKARCDVTDEMLGYIDVLVDGEFVLGRKDISLKFRGSSNQRLIDIPATLLKKGKVVMCIE